MRETSFLTYLRRLYHRLRYLRYKNNPETMRNLALLDFFDHAIDVISPMQLRPLLIKDKDFFVETVTGFFLCFSPGNLATKLWGIEETGIWEREAVELCQKWMANGGTFIDIGANVGYYSLAVAYDQPKTQVYAFEPVPTIFSVLEKNIEINELSGRVKGCNIALGEQSGKLRFFFQGQLSHALVHSSDAGSETVSVKSLDEFSREHQISNIRMIKCDAEGFELMVLKGARQILQEQKPALVLELEERWTNRYGYKPDDALEYLEQLGYRTVCLQDMFTNNPATLDNRYLNDMFFCSHPSNT